MTYLSANAQSHFTLSGVHLVCLRLSKANFQEFFSNKTTFLENTVYLFILFVVLVHFPSLLPLWFFFLIFNPLHEVLPKPGKNSCAMFFFHQITWSSYNSGKLHPYWFPRGFLHLILNSSDQRLYCWLYFLISLFPPQHGEKSTKA